MTSRPPRPPRADGGDASPDRPDGFGEAPQAAFEGAPLTGPVSDWARQIAEEASASVTPPRTFGPDPPHRGEGRSGADGLTSPSMGEVVPKRREGVKSPSRRRRSPPAPPRRRKTARGTSMGGAASPKERAAAGLNPVAGMDIALEDAAGLDNSGVTATVAALSRLIEAATPT
jgi:excinuclease ABC subunit B